MDDFVLFCMLVGNDFLPPLPTLDIGEGGLDTVLQLYRDMLPKLGGYLTDAGELRRDRLEALLAGFGAREQAILEERARDADDFEKRGGRGGRTIVGPRTALNAPGQLGVTPIEGAAAANAGWRRAAADLAKANETHEDEIGAATDRLLEAADDSGWTMVGGGAQDSPLEVEGEEVVALAAHLAGPTMMAPEARALLTGGHGEAGMRVWKRRYYTDKLGLPDDSDDSKRKVVQAYVEGLCWVLQYYYRGVASWEWFYPFHFSPPASDLVGLADCTISFELGKPFDPFQQLLSVMPPSSAVHLPEPYRWLMTEPARSPIADFYPAQFPVDYEGKRADWEGVALICFIDEKRLLEAERIHVPPERLSIAERARNREGDIFVFTHDPTSTETEFCSSTCPTLFPSVTRAQSKLRRIRRPPALRPEDRGFGPSLLKGVKTGLEAPLGFPTLHSVPLLPHELRQGVVNVFGRPTRKGKSRETSGRLRFTTPSPRCPRSPLHSSHSPRLALCGAVGQGRAPRRGDCCGSVLRGNARRQTSPGLCPLPLSARGRGHGRVGWTHRGALWPYHAAPRPRLDGGPRVVGRSGRLGEEGNGGAGPRGGAASQPRRAARPRQRAPRRGPRAQL